MAMLDNIHTICARDIASQTPGGDLAGRLASVSQQQRDAAI